MNWDLVIPQNYIVEPLTEFPMTVSIDIPEISSIIGNVLLDFHKEEI